MTLFDAIADNDLTAARAALECSADVNRRDEDGFTPLQLAVWHEGSLALLELLREHGAAVNDPGENVLGMAVQRNSCKTVEFLLGAGADVNARDEDGFTPLKLAVWRKCDLELVQLLLEYGAGVNVLGENLLSLAIRDSSYEIVELLLKAGADVTYCDDMGNDALIDALSSLAFGDDQLLPLLELLLAYGAPVNGRHEQGVTTLSRASFRDRFDVVARLLEAGSDVSWLQWTGLMVAGVLGSAEDVRRELAAAPDLNAVDTSSRTAWELALRVGDREKIELLHAAGYEIEARGDRGMTPLMHAVETGNMPAVAWLVEQGAGLDAQNEHGQTALMRAVWCEQVECVRYLLQAVADLHMTNDLPGELQDGELPGWMAIEMAGNPEIIWLLVEAGAELDHLNYEARTHLLGFGDDWEIDCSRQEYEEGKRVRYGEANPEKMDVPYWKALVRSGDVASLVEEVFEDDTEEEPEKVKWHYTRYGKSLTPLPDGRFIEIGGEYEYPNHAYIYNEVFVYDGKGNFEIYGYPRDVFQPTDFHSATLVGDYIFIIGGLGYSQDRCPSFTPVYRLDCTTLAIEKVATAGHHPGWIHGHHATHYPNKGQVGEIHVQGGCISLKNGDLEENEAIFVLDLASLRWRRGQE